MLNTISNYYGIQPVYHTKRECLVLKPLGRDTVSFTSVNLLKRSQKEITNLVKSVYSDTERIGFGAEGSVYKIPDTNYCVKVLKKESINNIGDWHFNVSEQDKVNNVVARADNGFVIMNFLEGNPLRWNKQEEIFNLPKNSYRTLLKQMTKANDECLKFDNSPANVIYNPKDKSLTAIDFYEPNPDVEYDFTPFSSIFTVLQNHSLSDTDMANNRKLGGKLLDIALDELSSGKEPEIEVKRDDVFHMFGLLKISQNLKEAPQMLFLRESFSNIFRLKDLPKNEDNTRRFNWNVMYARAIIKQVLG